MRIAKINTKEVKSINFIALSIFFMIINFYFHIIQGTKLI